MGKNLSYIFSFLLLIFFLASSFSLSINFRNAFQIITKRPVLIRVNFYFCKISSDIGIEFVRQDFELTKE